MKNEKITIDQLFEKVKTCNKKNECYGHSIYLFVPKPSKEFGRKNVKILFINEKPGPRTMKSGEVSPNNLDETAKNFRQLLKQTGLRYKDIFSTNACLCLPFCSARISERPSKIQRENCTKNWMGKQIELLKPQLIVSLGEHALKALKYLSDKSDKTALKYYYGGKKVSDCKMKTVVGNLLQFGYNAKQYYVYPMYHTSPQVQIKKPLQKKLWRKIPKILNDLKTLRKSVLARV